MDKQHVILAQNPNANNRDISIIVGRMWRNESEEVKELYRQKAENGRKEHMLRYPNYKYVPAKKRKDVSSTSAAHLRKKGNNANSDGTSPEGYIALTRWDIGQPSLENYAGVELQSVYNANIGSQLHQDRGGFQERIDCDFNKGNSTNRIDGIGIHQPLVQYPLSDLFAYPANTQPPPTSQRDNNNSFTLDFASIPQINSNNISAFGTSNLCSLQSLTSPGYNNYIQNDDILSYLPLLYQNSSFPQ